MLYELTAIKPLTLQLYGVELFGKLLTSVVIRPNGAGPNFNSIFVS